jgi:hypothetical protein
MAESRTALIDLTINGKETETAQFAESESHKTRSLMLIIGFLNELGERRLFFRLYPINSRLPRPISFSTIR